MKIAVASKGADVASEVDPHFGRAKFFIVIDPDSGAAAAHDNTQNLNAAQGAGIQSGRNVIDLGVEAVVSGNIGPKAFATLQAGGVKVYIGATGTVQEAIEQFRAGKIEEAGQANAESHRI